MSQSAENLKTLPDTFQELESRIVSGEARVCIVGLGTAGLPMLTTVAAAGFPAVGIDVDEELVGAINRGESQNPDVDAGLLGRLVREGRLKATRDFQSLAEAECVIVSVPTSSSAKGEPQLEAVKSVVREIARRLHRGQLIVIESTVPPGTTRTLLLPLLETAGLRVGSDFFLAFSPERIDPGNASFPLDSIPKVIGGVTEACTALASRLYAKAVAQVHPVSSAEVAETAKVFENTFRFVNISLANELSQICAGLGISVGEVLAAASTKPFAFMRHSPGPGVGGRCLPMASQYLRWAAEQCGAGSRIVSAAIELNDLMPELVATRAQALAVGGRAEGRRPTVLIIGVAYKPGVSDVRGSLALSIASLLKRADVAVQYHDPFVPLVSIDGDELVSLPLTAEVIQRADCVLILCPHPTIDYERIRAFSRNLLDPTNTIPDSHEG